MSFSNTDMIRTTRGTQLSVAAQAGADHIVYTRYALGSGYAASQAAIASMTELVSEKLSAPTTSIRAVGNQAILRGHYSNSDIVEAFNWREFGIFARGDDGVEILYCYVSDRTSTQVVEPNPTLPTVQIKTRLALIDGGQSVPLPEDAFITWEEFDGEIEGLGGTFLLKSGGNAGETVVTFSEQATATLTEVASGAKLSVLIGKIKQILTDMATALAKKVDTTTMTTELAKKADTTTMNTELAKKAVTATYTATIPAAGWTGSAAPYSIETIDVAGMLAADNPTVDIVQTGTWETDEAMRENWGKITRIVTKANGISVYASEIPSAAIPIQLKVVR